MSTTLFTTTIALFLLSETYEMVLITLAIALLILPIERSLKRKNGRRLRS